jgi:hypothetical protein
MKAYIQFTTNEEVYFDSPVLEIEVANKTSLNKLLASFKCLSVDPTKVMVDFIIFAHSALGKKVISIRSEDNGYFEVTQIPTRVPNVVEFVYKKDDGKTDWRKVDILEEDKYYVKGHDLNDNNSFKSFKKTNIVGGRIIKN